MMGSWRIIACLWAAVLTIPALPQSAAIRDALSDMQRGDFSSAERKLRAEVAAHPDDPMALSLLADALDNQHKLSEAAPFHARAVAAAPRSIEPRISYAAHFLMAGDEEAARKQYLQAIALDPAQPVANVQLARLALKKKNAAEALRYLDHLAAGQQEKPQVLLLQLEAAYLAGNTVLGEAAFGRISEKAKTDLNLSFAAATALSNAGQFDKAQALCEGALRAYPANFNVLYDLGVIATSAGHYSRASEVLETALRQHPDDVDVLFALARAEEASGQWEPAVRLLAKAVKIDPRRADIQQLLAVTATELGALEDAGAAWDRVLVLDPANDNAQRERAYVSAQMGQLEAGVRGLEHFVAEHPRDPLGHYELGQAQRDADQAKALHEFDQALALDPKHVPSLSARGSLYYQQGKPEVALKDLESAASLRPEDAGALDRLGQVYDALDRTPDALRVLRKAAELAPADSRVLLHYARALADAGRIEESKAVMDRFRELGATEQTPLPRGFVEYLSLTDDQRRADYRARVEKQVQSHPDDAAAQVAWLKLLIQSARWDQVQESARRIAAMQPGTPLLAEAGRALLAARQCAAARQVLQHAAAPVAGIQLDFALATFCTGDVAHALQELDKIPEAERGGDYFLAQAQMLQAAGRAPEAQTALDEALHTAPARVDFYQQAADFLVESNQALAALRFLDRGTGLLPNSREILLLKAIVQDLAGQSEAATKLLTEIQARWPEWYPAWVAHAIILDAHGQSEEARRAFRTASALGAPPAARDIDLKSILRGALRL